MSTSELLDSIANSLSNIQQQLNHLEMIWEKGMEQLHQDNLKEQRVFEEIRRLLIKTLPIEKPKGEKNLELTVEQIHEALGDLDGLTYIEVKEDCFLIKPRKYLGRENFAKIADIVKNQLGGEYISAGRDSHFRIQRR